MSVAVTVACEREVLRRPQCHGGLEAAENHYTRSQLREWLERARLEEISVRANYGWVGSGRRPAAGVDDAAERRSSGR